MSTSSKDRTGLCTFMFDDGRHCNMPHTQNELRLCYFHEKRELQRLMARDAGLQISRYLANLHTACDLNGSFAMLYRAGVQGLIESKMVNSLTRLGHLLVKTHLLAKEEYLTAYHTGWSDIVQQSVTLRPAADPHPHPNSKPAPSEPPAKEPTDEETPAGDPSPRQTVEDEPAEQEIHQEELEESEETEKLEEDNPENQEQKEAPNEELPEEVPTYDRPTPPLAPT